LRTSPLNSTGELHMLTSRTLGTQGLTVSALGLGLMGMSHAYGTPEERDERESIATIHRADNTDDETRLREISDALRGLNIPVVLLAHPRLIARASTFGVGLTGGALHTTTPLAYPQMVRVVMGSAGVVTDSGGLQKEAFLLGVPCTTIRPETEWVETLDGGWNILDPDLTRVRDVAARRPPTEVQPQPFGDGHAAAKVLEALRERSA